MPIIKVLPKYKGAIGRKGGVQGHERIGLGGASVLYFYKVFVRDICRMSVGYDP